MNRYFHYRSYFDLFLILALFVSFQLFFCLDQVLSSAQLIYKIRIFCSFPFCYFFVFGEELPVLMNLVFLNVTKGGHNLQFKFNFFVGF